MVFSAETLAAACLFAAAFLFGGRLHVPGNRRRRNVASFAAGAAIAYVFVDMLPQLHRAHSVFAEGSGSAETHLAEYAVYLAAMFGFVLFYGLEHLLAWSRPGGTSDVAEDKEHERLAFWLHVGGFCAYGGLLAYLLVRRLEEGTIPVLLYGGAVALHLLSVSHSLRREYAAAYDGLASKLLALAPLAGWAAGCMWDVHKPLVALGTGFVAGAVVMNSAVMELPREKEGRFLPFVLGALGYAVVLMFVG